MEEIDVPRPARHHSLGWERSVPNRAEVRHEDQPEERQPDDGAEHVQCRNCRREDGHSSVADEELEQEDDEVDEDEVALEQPRQEPARSSPDSLHVEHVVEHGGDRLQDEHQEAARA